MTLIKWLLDYVSTKLNAILTYKKSDMVLAVHSDASYLSKAEARSRVGGHFFYSQESEDPIDNGAVLNISKILKAVMSSAAEAELGTLYINAREAIPMRQLLTEMGHKQPKTIMITDNSTAFGAVNNNIQPRRTKAMDMCFHWLQDRIQQCQFRAQHVAGNQNVSDYFTKALPRCKHDQYAMPHTAYVILSMIPLHHLYYTFASYTILYVSYILLFYFVN